VRAFTLSASSSSSSPPARGAQARPAAADVARDAAAQPGPKLPPGAPRFARESAHGGWHSRLVGIEGLGHPDLEEGAFWPLHDIDITNIVWCLAYKREFGEGVVYCPIVVQ